MHKTQSKGGFSKHPYTPSNQKGKEKAPPSPTKKKAREDSLSKTEQQLSYITGKLKATFGVGSGKKHKFL
jgi:hypothetical protein